MKQYIHDAGFAYIRISELPNYEATLLDRWMAGQTRPLIEGLEPQDAVYHWDYERWKASQRGEFVLWD